MTQQRAKYCPRCGSTITGTACPRCVLGVGLQTETAPGPRHSFVPPTVDELATRLPNLEVLQLIGQGGMGAVYRARQRDLDRVVAVKVLPATPGGDPGFAERFAREARALARLNHPNIVTIYDFGRAGDLCYFVMEFVDGANVRQMLRAGTLAPADALRIVPQVCEALQFAHDEGIVHRDVKPENILVDRKGRVKIADFGLAKLVGSATPADVTLTAEHHVLGTPRYMAPEQVEGAAAVDHRADIYSLGVVLYEMLTGELPIGRFAPPSQKVQVDVRLDEVVLRTLEKEPARRYQSAGEVRTDLCSLTSVPCPPSEAEEEKEKDPDASLGRTNWFNQPSSSRKWTKDSLWVFAIIGVIMACSFESRSRSSGGANWNEWRVGAPGSWLTISSKEGLGLWDKWELHFVRWSFWAGVTSVYCFWELNRIARVERRHRDRRTNNRRSGKSNDTPGQSAGSSAPRAPSRILASTGSAPSPSYTLPPTSGFMLAFTGAALLVSGLVMSAGLALAVLAFLYAPPGSGPFWGWMGGAFGCFFGGGGSMVGSYNSYRQLTGRGDLMRAPGRTPLDRVLRAYTILGVLLLAAATITWRSASVETRHALLLLGGIVLVQGVLFLVARAAMRRTVDAPPAR